MEERMVDVFDRDGNLLWTYPVILGGLNYVPTEREYVEAALKCAKDDKLTKPDVWPLTGSVQK